MLAEGIEELSRLHVHDRRLRPHPAGDEATTSRVEPDLVGPGQPRGKHTAGLAAGQFPFHDRAVIARRIKQLAIAGKRQPIDLDLPRRESLAEGPGAGIEDKNLPRRSGRRQLLAIAAGSDEVQGTVGGQECLAGHRAVTGQKVPFKAAEVFLSVPGDMAIQKFLEFAGITPLPGQGGQPQVACIEQAAELLGMILGARSRSTSAIARALVASRLCQIANLLR